MEKLTAIFINKILALKSGLSTILANHIRKGQSQVNLYIHNKMALRIDLRLTFQIRLANIVLKSFLGANILFIYGCNNQFSLNWFIRVPRDNLYFYNLNPN
uniref:Uncharacterized protein n=1 Tax=Cacopsylla melanoneura TaxID=428564 RepID=A0A8D8ZI45_9HEMI